MTEKFPNLRRNLDNQVHETHKWQNQINLKWSSLRHITKQSNFKDKKKNLKSWTRKNKLVTYNGNSTRLWTNFSAKTLQCRRELGAILKVLKEENCQPRTLNQAKLSKKKEKDFPTANKREGNSSPQNLPYKKYWKKFLKLKWKHVN